MAQAQARPTPDAWKRRQFLPAGSDSSAALPAHFGNTGS
jgi:hypothetical protein